MAARRRAVVWTQRALDSLEEALAFIALDAEDAARMVAERALAAAASLETLSERGRVVPEFADPSFRQLLVDPYRLIYQISGPEVHVIALVHQARDFGAWVGGRD